MQITVDQSSFVKGFLQSVSAIAENARVDVDGGVLESLVHSADNTCILLAKCKTTTEDTGHFNIPNLKKFARLLGNLDGDVALQIEGNKIKHSKSKLSFEYFLLDDSYIGKAPLNKNKIQQLETDVCFVLEGSKLSEVLKLSSVTSDTEKVYFSTCDGEVVAELNDKEKHNVTNVALTIAEECEGTIPAPIPFLLNNFRNISFNAETQLVVKINTGLKLAAIQFKPSSSVALKYIFTGLVR
jgi:hypothetical protein